MGSEDLTKSDDGGPSRLGYEDTATPDDTEAGLEHRVLQAAMLSRLAEKDGAPAVKIGRFAVLSRLGSGGMGTVFSAYDEELDRRVAIKVLHRESGKGASKGQSRLRREAQAMAKLSHPNVAQVYEVGMFEGQVYLAMEFVKGQTITEWLKEAPRHWREIVDVFQQAGRGVAAAHAAGLVHRDFKPDNVMIASDGRVRVLDFGLVRASGEEASVEEASIEIAELAKLAQDRPLDTPLTATGAVIGTPAYMSPEQFHGQANDAKADQFSFCVSLYEGLYGERPFAGKSWMSLAMNVIKGEVRKPPAGTSVPTWLHKVVLRGLEADPYARFDSMDDLLAELGRDPARKRRRIFGVAAVLAVVAGALGSAALWQQKRSQACSGAEAKLAGVWDETRKRMVEQALLATGVSHAQDTWQRVEKGLDEYTAKWANMQEQTCEATQIRHEQSAERMHLRMACLEKRLWEVEGLTKVLSNADHEVAENAIGAAAALTPVQRCAGDNLRVELVVPEAPEVRDSVAAQRTRLAEAKALEDAGKYAEGVALAEQIAKTAIEIGYSPFVAEARYRLGSLQRQAGNYAKAETELVEAIGAAEEGRLDEIAARAQSLLVMVVGYDQARHDEGRFWARQARAKLRRLPGADDLEAELLAHRGVLNGEAGLHDDATSQLERALAIRIEIFGSAHPLVALSRKQLGNVYYQQSRLDEAFEQYSQALQIREQTFGPSHPAVAEMHNNLGIVLQSKGDLARALAQHERAWEIWEVTLDPDHPNLGLSHHNMAMVLSESGEHERARQEYERALAIDEKALGAAHPRTALAHAHLGSELMFLGDSEASRDHFEKALAIWREIHGTDHPDYAYALTLLGDWCFEQQNWAQALDHHTRALAIRERALGPEHGDVAESLTRVGVVHVRTGRDDLARPLLRRALEITKHETAGPHPVRAVILRELGRILLHEGRHQQGMEHLEQALAQHEGYAKDPLPDEAAATRFLLAKTLWKAGKKPRSRELAKKARDRYAKAGKRYAKRLAEVDAWLRKRGSAS